MKQPCTGHNARDARELAEGCSQVTLEPDIRDENRAFSSPCTMNMTPVVRIDRPRLLTREPGTRLVG